MKTPLTFGEGSDREWYIHDADENWIAEAVPNEPGEAEETARRIVACVNACEGISDEALDSWLNPPEGGFGHPHGPWPAHIISLQRAAGTLKQQRDELLTAMQYLRQHKLWGNSHAKAIIDSVIEKVGAGETAVQGDMLLPANGKVTGAPPHGAQQENE